MYEIIEKLPKWNPTFINMFGIIYVKGDLVVNGTISMTARGSYTPSINSEVNSQGLQFQRFTASGTDSTPVVDSGSTIRGAGNAAETSEANQKNINGAGTIFSISKSGGAGAPARGSNIGSTGEKSSYSLGGGGSGGSPGSELSGAGTAGTCFSGGAGGAGNAGQWGSPNADGYGEEVVT